MKPTVPTERERSPIFSSRSRRRRGLLQPGRNCWKVKPCSRLGFLVDGDSYFRAFREAVGQARRSVLILAWDIDSDVPLIRGGPPDGLPGPLGDFLHAVAVQQPDLHIYVLSWDFAIIYALERQWFPMHRAYWRRHPRVHFHLDGTHPMGASHHQKVVVVDDAVAFVGGLDLTNCRWDTSDHRPDNPWRVEPNGRSYAPFHDVQMVVAGEAAAALGQLARDRWQRATGREIPAGNGPPGSLPWPASVQPVLNDVPVGLARTEPEFDGWPQVREVEHLYLDAIAAARRSIYIETQYFTCSSIADALAKRLKEPDGPQIVIVLPRKSDGLLEQYTMDALRTRVLTLLRRADRYDRLGTYYPDTDGLTRLSINVHSKILIVDDELVQVGTANLSNRSMRVDTECGLAVEAGDDARVRQAIGEFRNRLLGEHLGTSPDAVTEACRRHGSLLSAVEESRHGFRALKPIDGLEPVTDAFVLDPDIADPTRPFNPDQLANELRHRDTDRAPSRWPAVLSAAFVLALMALTAAWQWTSLGDWLTAESITQMFDGLKSSPAAPFFIMGGYLIGGLMAMPVTLLNGTVIVAFGPGLGLLYALTGSIMSSLLLYGLGYALGRKTLRRLGGTRMEGVDRFLLRRGLVAILGVRIVPVAPFTVVNLVAGALHVRVRDFVLGTALGLLPGLGFLSVFLDQVRATFDNPAPTSLLLCLLLVGGMVAAMFILKRRLRRSTPMRRPLHSSAD
jgi:phospholipase D1/2